MENERVGVICRDGRVIELNNISSEPTKSFSVAPEDMIKYEEEAIATWHTHPASTADLSGEDYIGFSMWPDFLHLISGTDGMKGYLVTKGMVIHDARKDHPAWHFAEDLAAQLRVRSQDTLGSNDGIDGHAQDPQGAGE